MQKDTNPYISYYFVSFILVGSFFFLNLFTGAIFFNFNKAHKNEKSNAKFSNLMSDDQKRWVELQKMIATAKPEFKSNEVPSNKILKSIYFVVTSTWFESLIMLFIILNIITMGLSYDTQSNYYENVLSKINLFFTSIFFFECVMKIVALGFHAYWLNPWNKFDFFVVLSSVVDLLMDIFGKSFISFLRVGPQLARVMRVLRVSRLFKLVKNLQGLQKQLQIMLYTLPSLLNVGVLMLLVFFIFSVLGCFLFRTVRSGEAINELNNFSNFLSSILTLFRCSTGEDWFKFMFDTMKVSSKFILF